MEPHTPKKTRRKRGRGPKKSAEAATGRYQEKAQDVMATESTAAVATATIRPLQEEEHSEEEELKGILDPLERSDDKGDAASGDQSSDGELPSDIDSDDGSDDAPAASNPPTARGSDADDDNVSDASEQPATQATRAAKAKKTAAKARPTRAALGKKKKTAPKSNKSASTRSSFATKSHTFNMPKWLEDEIGIPHTNPAFQLLIDEGWVSPLDLTLLEEETFQTIFEKKKFQSIPILAQQRLLHAYKWAIRCKAIGREVTEATMARGVIQDFAEEWKEIEEQMDRKEQLFPAFTSGMNPQVYDETVRAWLQATPGKHGVPLIYLIREKTDPGSPPPLAASKCFSIEYESLIEEMIAFMPLSGVSYHRDEAYFATKIKMAAINSTYYATLKPHLNKNNGRDAYFLWTTLLTNKAEWLEMIKLAKDFLRKPWNFHHRNAYKNWLAKFTTAVSTIAQAAAAGHPCTALSQTEIVNAFISCLTLDQRGRPEQLSALNTALSVVRQNSNGELHNFDLASKLMTDNMPVTKKRPRTEAVLPARISDVSSSSARRKKGKKEGEDCAGGDLTNLRTHHTEEEISRMSAAQKAEHFQWKCEEMIKHLSSERTVYKRMIKSIDAQISELRPLCENTSSDDEDHPEESSSASDSPEEEEDDEDYPEESSSASDSPEEEEDDEDYPEEYSSASDSPEEEEDVNNPFHAYSSTDEEQTIPHQSSDEDYSSDEDQALISASIYADSSSDEKQAASHLSSDEDYSSDEDDQASLSVSSDEDYSSDEDQTSISD